MEKHKIPVKAFIRIRSINNRKTFIYNKESLKITTENNQESEYFFDGIFPSSTSQKKMFQNIQESINKFKEGFNTTIFCYGNTGSGKTHTMIGSESDPGLIFNIVQDLLKTSFINISYMEIYNEKIFDLLEPKELILRENYGNIIIQNVKIEKIINYDEFKDIFNKGNLNRKTAETKLNKKSSRSHSILQINMNNTKLYLIDLAGSENNRKTGNEGLRMLESNSINKSLFVLGKVVNSILNNEIRIPYRDSKLTRLLQDSLGGTSICYIIANIIDDWDYIEETISTLKFASKSRKIINIKQNVINNTKSIDNKIINNKFKSIDKSINNKSIDNKSINNKSINNKSTKKINNILNDKTNTPKKRKKEDSTFILKSSIIEKSEILLTPNTQEKSYKAFLKRAQDFEKEGNYKKALDDYKTLKKIRDNFEIQEKIENLNNLIKGKKIKDKITKREVLDILNSGNFIQIKKLSGIGDKRAQSIVDFINGGHYFENLDDLKLIFSDKIITSILKSIN